MQSKPRSVDVQTLINENKFSAYQWVIFALCFFIVLLDGFDTAAIGYIAPSLIKDWGVTKSMLGPVLSAALFGLAAGALSAGPLADRFGRKLVLTSAVLVFGLACFASSFAGDLRTLTVLRFITGLGLGGGNAKCGHADERVLPGQAPRHADQSDVLRLSARRGLWWLSGRLDDPAMGLAQRFAAGRHHTVAADRVADSVAARIGTFLGRQAPPHRAHSRGAGADCW
jgi:hypothetical protein